MKKYIWGVLLSFLCFPVGAEDLDLVVLEDSSAELKNIVQPVGQLEKITYTWDDFLQGKSCQDDFNRLQKLDFISQEQQFLKDKMQAYCITLKRDTVWMDLLNVFRQSKKNLFVNKILRENGTFFGYIRALPYFLVDVHNTHPTGNALKDKLDSVQNAIQNKEPEEVLTKIQDLAVEDQLYLNTIFNEAGALLDFKNALKGRDKL